MLVKCVVGMARRNMYTMRRSSGRTAQCWWLWRLSGPGGYRVVASCDLRGGSWGIRGWLWCCCIMIMPDGWMLPCWVYRYTWEWRGLGRGGGGRRLCYETEGWAKERRCAAQRQTTAWQEAVIRLSAGAGDGTAVVYNQGWMVACA